MVPGDTRPAYDSEEAARQVLEDAENDLRSWEPSVEPIGSFAEDAARTGNDSLSNETEQDVESVATGRSGVKVGNAVPSSSKQLEEPAE